MYNSKQQISHSKPLASKKASIFEVIYPIVVFTKEKKKNFHDDDEMNF